MGLGKTLTMIGLAATDLEPELYEDFPVVGVAAEKGHNGATLVIVPPPRKRRRKPFNLMLRSEYEVS
jgi:hypothetical protein